jgi:uncharacterized C2H2 Zn-finger protein
MSQRDPFPLGVRVDEGGNVHDLRDAPRTDASRTSIRCLLGRHTGQKEGGTMMFTCPRCGGSFWQKHDLRAVTAHADRLIDAGRSDEALDYARREIKRRA